MDIKGRAAIVTGSSSEDGIGAACARILASRGCNVVVNYATNKAGAEKVEGDRLKVALPDAPSLDTLVLGLNAAAAQAGVDVTAIQPSPPSALTGAAVVGRPASGQAPVTGTPGGAGPTPAEPLSEIHFSLTALGGGTQLLDFLNRLDKLGRVVVVDGISLSGGKLHAGGQGEGTFTATLTARAFVHQAPPGATRAS